MMALTGSAQTYDMEIILKDGSKQTIAADKVSEVRFVRSQAESLTLGSEKLQILNIGGSNLKNYDIAILPSTIREINVDGLEYTSLDFTRFPEAEVINCSQNALTELNVAGLSHLKKNIVHHQQSDGSIVCRMFIT